MNLKGISEGFWGDEKTIREGFWGDEKTIIDAQVFEKRLKEIFPHAKIQETPPRGTITVSVLAGDHLIGVTGNTTNDDTKWEAFWRQNVSIFTRSIGVVDKATRKVGTDRGLTNWLSWVHTQIVHVACTDIKNALRPDNFLPSERLRANQPAFRAGNTLHALGIEAHEVIDLVIQRFPWKGLTNLKAVSRILRSKRIGTLAVQYNDGIWRCGFKVDVTDIHVKHKLSTADISMDDIDTAKLQCERLYAQKMTEWLMEKGHLAYQAGSI